MKRWLAHGALVLVGLLTGLAAAEAVLRWYAALRDPQIPAASDGGALRILCLGDSFAYGLGAEDGRGPCEHLEELLEARWGPDTVAVFNRAVPGFNSSQTLDALPAALAEARPALVLVTVGHNNGWNFAGLHLPDGEAGPLLRLQRALGTLRLVRALQLWRGYDRAQPAAPQPADPAAEAWLDRLNREAKARKFAAERSELTALYAAHPDDVWTLVKLAALAREAGDREEERRWLELAQAANARLGVEGHLVGREASRRALFAAVGGGTLDQQRQVVDGVLRRDLADLVAQARRTGAAVVFSGYPGDKPANAVLAAQADALVVPFVDQHAAFAALLAAEGDPGRWFVLDGHCTSAGYRRVAEALVPEVERLVQRD